MINALVWGCVRHLRVRGDHDRCACMGRLKVRGVVILLFDGVVGRKLSVPAVILGAAQSLPSHLSKACAVAGTEASAEGLVQGAVLGEGEAQTGNDCTEWCAIYAI